MKKLKSVMSVVLMIILAALILLAVLYMPKSIARGEIYNIAISLIVILLCVISIVSFLLLGKVKKGK